MMRTYSIGISTQSIANPKGSLFDTPNLVPLGTRLLCHTRNSKNNRDDTDNFDEYLP